MPPIDDPRAGEVSAYVEPSERWGWRAVASEDLETTRYFIPAMYVIWRPSRSMAAKAIPTAQRKLCKMMERRAVDVTGDQRRRRQREYVSGP